MKEELKKYIDKHAFFGGDMEVTERYLMIVIDDFFDQYQPERLNPEASKEDVIV